MLLRMALLLAALCVVIHSGCDSDSAVSTTDASLCGNDDASTHASDIAPDTGPPTADLTGRWAMLQVLTATVNIAGAQASENRVTTVVLADVKATEDSLLVTETICDIRLKNIAGVCGDGSLVTTEIPDAYIQSIEPVEREGTVNEENGEFRIHLPRLYQVKGVKLDDPSADGMPTNPQDEAYWDQDGDGKPGMTLRFIQPGMLVGELYVGQRDWTEMTGTVTGGGSVGGTIEWFSEQVTLGSNPETLLDSSPKSAPSTDASKSYFKMVRIGDAMDCSTVVADLKTLFPADVSEM